MTKMLIDRQVVEHALHVAMAAEHPVKLIAALRAALAEPVQEPVAWRFEARHIDSAWAAAVTLKHPGPEGVYMRNVMPLYAHPPQRPAEPVQEGCDHCNHPLYAAVKCRVCGRAT